VIAIRSPDPVRAAGASLGAFLLASPVLHPWYLLWVLPFAALFRNAAFLYLSVSAMFGYALLHPVAPFSPGLVLALEYGPFAALLALDAFRRGREPAAPATLRTRQASPESGVGPVAPKLREGSEGE